MGQQQLLLLVLSTVIVGLATVAGIQAFSENQAQATQDALIQRSTQIASDLVAADGKPSQMGGIDLTNGSSKTSDWANAIGLSSDTGIDAGGAGDGAACEIKDGSGDGSYGFDGSAQAYVECDGPDGAEIEVGINPGDASGDDIGTAIVTTASA